MYHNQTNARWWSSLRSSLGSQVPSPVSFCCSESFRNPLICCNLFRLAVLLVVKSLFFLLLLLCVILQGLPISVVSCFSNHSFLHAVHNCFLPEKFSYGVTFLSHLLLQGKAIINSPLTHHSRFARPGGLAFSQLHLEEPPNSSVF